MLLDFVLNEEYSTMYMHVRAQLFCASIWNLYNDITTFNPWGADSAELWNIPGYILLLCSMLSINKLKGQEISLHGKQAEWQPNSTEPSTNIYWTPTIYQALC